MLIAVPVSTSAGFSRAKSPATCRSILGLDSIWSSTSPPQRHWASKFRPICSRSRTRSSNETPRVHHAARRRDGSVAARRRRLVGDSWNNDCHMRRECMRCQSSFAFIPLMILPLVTIAKAHDASRYPNLKGQWTVIITAGLEGQAVKFDPTKPWGRGQQAPLTAEYRKVHEDSMADQAKGGLGNYPTATCHAGGMPRMMSTGEYEYIVEPETTYILIGGEDH